MSDEIQSSIEPIVSPPAEIPSIAVVPLAAEVVPAISPVAVAPAEPAIVSESVVSAVANIPVYEMTLAQRLEAIIHAFEHVSVTAARDLVYILHKDVSGA